MKSQRGFIIKLVIGIFVIVSIRGLISILNKKEVEAPWDNGSVSTTTPTTFPASIYFNDSNTPVDPSNSSQSLGDQDKRDIKKDVQVSEPLVLLSQNDGEIYMTGSTTNIVWSGGNIKDPIRIYLESYQKTILSIQGVISTTTIPLDGELAWKVGDIYDKETGEKLPFEAQLSSYIIRIEDMKTGDFVQSRVPFTIIDSQ